MKITALIVTAMFFVGAGMCLANGAVSGVRLQNGAK